MLKYVIAILLLLFMCIVATKTFAAETIWKYQCIDTMKTSRDNARRWIHDPKLSQYIDKELSAIVDMGANCVALDTPYNDEFLPYLRLWVMAAREKKLMIWYRGNFSEWEGWFDYPKGMSIDELIKRSNTFIHKNADLFEDGDVYTAAPEAENGGPFNQVELDEHPAYRKFLIRVYNETKKSFADIHKKVDVNWLSMNGGLARRMFDPSTVDAIGGIVTIDHYIKTPPEMTDYIEYFKKKFGAKIIIGEFGAPVPDINGDMTEDEQADYIDKIFHELYKYKDDVYAINYWVTYDSSTALLNPDYSPKKAVEVIKKYFKPGIVRGIVKNTEGSPIANVVVKTSDEAGSTKTNRRGEYSILLPEQNISLLFADADHKTKTTNISILSGKELKIDATLQPINETIWYRLRIFLKRWL